MLRERQTQRFRVAFAICMVLGLIEAAVIIVGTGHFAGGVLAIFVGVMFWLALGVILGALQVFPYAFIVLGVAKIRDQRREALADLGDENKVIGDPDGERKLGEYLTAITSTEARIGLLQRSNYVPLEQRMPGAVIPRATISRQGWVLVTVIIIAGAACGVAIGLRGGLGEREQAVATVQLIVAALVGMVVASPIGMILALLFGRVEEPDEPGGSDQQTA